MRLDLLAIAAHPDDVELSCGGTLIKMGQGQAGISDLLKSLFVISPLIKELKDQYDNVDSFTRKPIRTQPGVLGGAEGTQHAMAGMFSPLATLGRAWRQGSVSPILQEALGYKDPTAQQMGGQAWAKQQEERERQKGLKGIRSGKGGPIPYWADILMQHLH